MLWCNDSIRMGYLYDTSRTKDSTTDDGVGVSIDEERGKS